MDIVIAVAARIAEYTVAPIGRQLGYIVFYKTNIKELNTKVENLLAAKDTLQHSIDAAKRNGEEIEVNVQNWLMEVDGTIDKAKGFQNNEGHNRVGCSNGSCPNLWTRHQLSRKATKMAKEISQVSSQGNFNKISYLPPLPATFTPFARGYEVLDSRTLILNEIMQELKDDNNMYMIGVYGMPGVGKSTLVNELAWQAEHAGSFDAVVVTNVTNPPNVKQIQGKLADLLGLRFEENSEEGKARRLWNRIRKENKILVILDDILEKFDLVEVGVPFGDDHKGCKLVLTSRNLNVLSNGMGTQKNFRLETLSEEESWSLFERKAGDVVKDIRIQPIASEVAKACVGLPLLIVAMAKALKNQKLYAWKDALTQLKKFDNEELPSKANEAVELSYKYLGSDQLRSLFLLIGSYGQKYGHVEDLLTRGWCLGLFKNVESLTDARNRLYKMVDDLKASSLLLEGEREWIRMHDVIRDGATKIASGAHLAFRMQRHHELKEWPNMDQLRKCKHIFLPWCYMAPLPECLECPELEILVICSQDDYLEVPNQFFSMMRDLKFLDLGGMMCTPSLPPSLGFLKNLRALYLYQCILEDISIISELTSLEILSLENSEIEELPKEIQQLSHLHMLNLGNCSRLRLIPTNVLSRLTCLEELYMGNCYIQWEIEGNEQSKYANLGELRPLLQLKSLDLQVHDTSIMPRDLLIFEKLERYNIVVGDGWKCLWNYSGYSETSRTLKLDLSSSTCITHLDLGIKMLLNGVEDLSLAKLKGVKNVLPELNAEGFPQLKHLQIQNNAEMLCIIDSTNWTHPSHPFLNLESMVLCNLINLEKICYSLPQINIFTKLKVTKVEGCERLKSVFSFSVVRKLPHLVEIEISKCKSLTHVIAQQGQEEFEDNLQINFPKVNSIKLECLPNLNGFSSMQWTTERDVHSGKNATEHRDNLSNPLALFGKVTMPQLETIKLSSINTVKLWDDVSALSCIQNLTSLTLDNCGGLKYLFSFSVCKALVKLQYLEITNCKMMESIFALEGKLDNLHLNDHKPLTCDEVIFPNLETLVVSHMENLKSICPDELAQNLFRKLIKIEISFCQRLLILFPACVMHNLLNLERLDISDCATLEVVFETEGLNSDGVRNKGTLAHLRTLTLERLPLLKHIWSNDFSGRLQLQNLCTMTAFQCQSLSHVFPFSVASELLQLQKLQIINCGVESIVAMGETVNEDSRLSLPRLKSLTFWTLKKLSSFYPGSHTLHCPLLKKLDIRNCKELERFKPKSQNRAVVAFHKQPLFSSTKVIPHIEELSLSNKEVTDILNGEYHDGDLHIVKTLSLYCFHDELDKFPMSFLQKFTNLETLEVVCSSFIEFFSSENDRTIIKLRTLELQNLQKLEYLCKENFDIRPILQNLEFLIVLGCSRLKNIVPSSSPAQFLNLDTLRVESCANLVNIMMPSLAKSSLKLRQLCITDCEMIEEIVAIGNDSDEGEISFMKLEHLHMENLPRLTKFCKGNYSFKFPLLQSLLVIECPMMETFSNRSLSAPILRRVNVTHDNEWLWEGEINTTIRKLSNKKGLKED